MTSYRPERGASAARSGAFGEVAGESESLCLSLFSLSVSGVAICYALALQCDALQGDAMRCGAVPELRDNVESTSGLPIRQRPGLELCARKIRTGP